MEQITQQEAEAILDVNTKLGEMSTVGATHTTTSKMIRIWQMENSKEFQRAFDNPENSPWKIELRGKNRKKVIVWRSNWKG